MPNPIYVLAAAAVLLFVAIGPGTAAADDLAEVPVRNAGFEEDILATPGQSDAQISGWQTSAGMGQGVYRPRASDYLDGAPDGVNVSFSNSTAGRIWQELSTKLQANTKYVLKVEVGWNNVDRFAGYVVQLRTAGGPVLAQDEFSQTPPRGTFVTSTVEFTPDFGHPQIGEPIEVRLFALGVQANFDDVRLTSECVGVCAERLLLPLFVVDRIGFRATTLFSVNNATGETVTAVIEYFTVAGDRQRMETVVLAPLEVKTVNLRDVPELVADGDGFARGFVKVTTAGRADRTPVLWGDSFQIDNSSNFATGNVLVRQCELCSDASIRFVESLASTRLAVYVSDPRGSDQALDPPSFIIQEYDETGKAVGAPQPFWTTDHAVELAASDHTTSSSGTLRFDFTNGLGGVVHAEYSADDRFLLTVPAHCNVSFSCDECCPPGSRKATAEALHFSRNETSDCRAAISQALRTLDSFQYRDACRQTYGGSLPSAVLGARAVDCEVGPEAVVVDIEVCCPAP